LCLNTEVNTGRTRKNTKEDKSLTPDMGPSGKEGQRGKKDIVKGLLSSRHMERGQVPRYCVGKDLNRGRAGGKKETAMGDPALLDGKERKVMGGENLTKKNLGGTMPTQKKKLKKVIRVRKRERESLPGFDLSEGGEKRFEQPYLKIERKKKRRNLLRGEKEGVKKLSPSSVNHADIEDQEKKEGVWGGVSMEM